MIELRARLEAASPDGRAELRTRLAQEVRGAFSRVTFGPDRIELTDKGMVPFGAVRRASDVTVLVYTENPHETVDLATMELGVEELREKDRKVEEFLRLARLRREGIRGVPGRPRDHARDYVQEIEQELELLAPL